MVVSRLNDAGEATSSMGRDAATRLKNGTCETMSLPDYDSRCRAESERGLNGRLERELRWCGNLIDGQRRCYKPGDF